MRRIVREGDGPLTARMVVWFCSFVQSALSASRTRVRFVESHLTTGCPMRALLAGLAVLSASAVRSQTPAVDPSRIEHLLRPALHIAGRPDPTFDIIDRMRVLHVPGASVAIVDNFKIVFAKGYGVTEFGGSKPVDTTTLF